jgi:hypothetical protein
MRQNHRAIRPQQEGKIMNNKPRFFIGIAFGLVFGFLFALAGWIGFSVGFQTSFWFGFGLIGTLAIAGIGLIATVQLASHPSTSIKTSRRWKAWAFAVGAFTLLTVVGLVLLLVLMQFALVGAVFNGNNVWLGVISAFLVAISIASYPVFGLLAVRLSKTK